VHLLAPEHLDAVAELSAVSDPEQQARELVRRGWLTGYQVNELFRGRGDKLLLGSYVLLEKLGEGGMRAVFKAHNWKLGQLVALKLIRKERINNEQVLRRFEREIRAAALLDHPNVVRALDAVEIDGTLAFVMEHVEGIDLGRMVQKKGPLPTAEACECIRQAALGLQHAFEKGLVHRDIKPSNLLLEQAPGKPGVPLSPTTSGGLFRAKLLDMGLARVVGNEEETSTLTREGAVMGTVDYLAPEQAVNAHVVDIRADLYSLGCTLHFLLTAQPPYPGGTAGDKIGRHLAAPPASVRALRPEVPLSVESIQLRLLAKKPEDRNRLREDVLTFQRQRVGTVEAVEAVSLLRGLPSPLDELTRAAIPEEERRESGDSEPAKILPELAAILGSSRLRHWGGILAVAYCPDGERLVAECQDQLIRIWDTRTGRELAGLRRSRPDGMGLAISPDGKRIAASDHDTARVWEAGSGRELFTGRHSTRITSVALHPDGRTLAISGAERMVAIHNLSEREVSPVQIETEEKIIGTVVFSPDGKSLATCAVVGGASLWNAASSKLIRAMCPPNTGAVHVAFSPDGRHLALSTKAGTVRLQDAETGKERPSLKGHTVSCRVVFSPEGRTFLSSGSDGLLILRNLERKVLRRWKLPGPIRSAAYSPDCRFLATANSNSTIYILRLNLPEK
jgi:serine/threonine protein kinase